MKGYARTGAVGSYPLIDGNRLREEYIVGDWIAFQFTAGTPGFMGAISTSNGNHSVKYSQQFVSISATLYAGTTRYLTSNPSWGWNNILKLQENGGVTREDLIFGKWSK